MGWPACKTSRWRWSGFKRTPGSRRPTALCKRNPTALTSATCGGCHRGGGDRRVGGYSYGRRSSPAAPHPSSYVYNIPLPPTLKFYAGVAISPDGGRLAVVTQPPSGQKTDPRLWIRDMDSVGEWQMVSGAGDEIPHYPIWKPDGRSLAFFLMGHLVRVDLPSVVPIEICAAEDGRGGVWLDDDTIVFAPGPRCGLTRVDVRTGQQQEFIALGPGEEGLKYPVWPATVASSIGRIPRRERTASCASSRSTIRNIPCRSSRAMQAPSTTAAHSSTSGPASGSVSRSMSRRPGFRASRAGSPSMHRGVEISVRPRCRLRRVMWPPPAAASRSSSRCG